MENSDLNIIPIRIEDEMRNSYMDYSMSVIIGRALPDVRDGLKPVHRRILYAMFREGHLSSKKHSKCAGVVGEVLKKYHPHGDSAVYDALVRMGQNWNLRYLLIDKQGNFGSIDGDPPAAYRYTESRLTKLAEELLVDIDKETVDWTENFDGNHLEPTVLPARFPNLLLNGAEGIAVGMATKIPPHNLTEIINACIALIERPTMDVDELMQLVPAPDFPTAGTIYGRAGVRDAYATGRGRLVVRGHAFFEDNEQSGRTAIIIDELPYQVNKARLVEQIAQLVKDKRLEGIADLRDESDRDGMRVVIELKRDAVGDVVLNHLYKSTPLQSTFGVIMLSIVNNRPRILTLKEMLQQYLSHRRDVITRRTRFELRKARERAHILEGYRIALDNLDEVITLIRNSPSVAAAREGLMSRFGLSEVQAQAILELRLQRLTGMERARIDEEYAEVMQRIGELEHILGSDIRLWEVIREDLEDIRASYGDERRTRIVESRSELSMHDLIAKEDQVVTMSHLGYIKRCSPDEWRMQHRGGTGKRGMNTRDEDFVESLFIANTHSLQLVFTNKGKVFPLHVYDVPEAGRDARGRPIVNLVPVPPDEKVTAVLPVSDMDDHEASLLFVSKQGLVKRTSLGAYKNLRSGGLIAAGVADDDELIIVRLVEKLEGDLMLLAHNGQSIRFDLAAVPDYSRTARGNKGMKLDDDDWIVDALLVPSDADVPILEDDEEEEEAEAEDSEDTDEDDESEDTADEPWETTLLCVTELGYGKRTPFNEYRVQGRNGKGIRAIHTGERNGPLAGAVEVSLADQLMLVTDTGRVIRFAASSIRLLSRNTKGVKLMRLEPGERVVDLARLVDVDDDEDQDVEGEVEELESEGEASGEETEVSPDPDEE